MIKSPGQKKKIEETTYQQSVKILDKNGDDTEQTHGYGKIRLVRWRLLAERLMNMTLVPILNVW